MYIELISKEYQSKFNSFFNSETNKKIDFFGPVNYINILVGANNSGKSRFMREFLNSSELYSSDSQFYMILYDLKDYLLDLISNSKFILNIERQPFRDSYNSSILSIKDNADYSRRLSFFRKYFQDNSQGNLSLNTDVYINIKNIIEKLVEEIVDPQQLILNTNKLKTQLNYLYFIIDLVDNGESDFHYDGLSVYNIKSVKDIVERLRDLKNKIENFVKFLNFKSLNFSNKVYIPVLRSAKSFSSPSQQIGDIYSEKIFNDYKIPREFIFSGLNLYDTLATDSAQHFKIRKNVKEFEKFLSLSFFENQNIELTARRDPEILKDKIITITSDEKIERKLYDVGDGINAIIVLMYKIFTTENETWFFIEEPELNLHPAFQRIFLETLLNNDYVKKKNLKIFFSTHSNHLLDISLEYQDKISIFIFERKLKDDNEIFYIKHISHGDLSILNNLGVRNTSVFISNCIIWVEGITDRKYIKSYLEAYYNSGEFKKEKLYQFQEDLHYAFFEYAGSNLIHYEFNDDSKDHDKISAKFLSNRIFLLADKDENKESKHKKLLENVGVHLDYEVTEGMEIENLLSVELLKEGLLSFPKKFNREQVEKESINEEDYKDEHLGGYVDKKFGTDISVNGGTLSQYYKNNLAESVSKIVTWDNMSESAKTLTKKIYEFIKNNNK